MMYPLFLMISFIFTFHSCDAFHYEDCGPKDAVVRFEDVSIKPDILVFGGQANAAATVSVLQEVRSGISIVETHRLIRVFGYTIPVPIPCVWGDCRVSVCKDLGPRTIPCQWLKQANRTCGCPLKRDTIKSANYAINIPSLKPIYSMFLSGSYRIRWTWLDDHERETACMTVDLDFASKNKGD